jgi:hypothetical protein
LDEPKSGVLSNRGRLLDYTKEAIGRFLCDFVVIMRGIEKCFCDPFFSTGDDGSVSNDHVV